MALVQESPSFRLPMDPTSAKPFSPLGERPKSALKRGVQIRDFNGSRVNPEPIVLEETEILLDEYLSPRKLRNLTGTDDLDQVQFLEMKVDTSETSLGNFGALLPNLKQLKVSNSIIYSARDLGSSLDELQVLWMARCGLQELDGLSGMCNLRELYLAYNEVSDLSPCSFLEKLQILDLEGNNIDSLAQVEFLSMCSNLNQLTLEGNPICVTPDPDAALPDYNYRNAIKKSLPQVQILDDDPLVIVTDTNMKKSASMFDDDWNLLNELIAEGELVDSNDNSEINKDNSISEALRPLTGVRPPTAHRPGTALKPTTAMKRPNSSMRPTTALFVNTRPGSAARPGTAARPGSGGRPGSARPGTARPGTARPSSGGSEASIDDTASSDLTQGTVVCGNPSKALRSRKKQVMSQQQLDDKPKLFSQFHYKPEHINYDPELENDEKLKSIFQELKEWKVSNKETRAKIQAEKAPQILRLDDDEDVISSASSIESDDGDEFDPSEVRNTNMYSRNIHRRTRSSGQRRRQKGHDETHDCSDDDDEPYSSRSGHSQSAENMRSPDASMISVNDDAWRPITGPAAVLREKFSIDPPTGAPKVIDKPVIRMSNQPVERIAPNPGPRAVTARAAMALPSKPLIKRPLPPNISENGS